MLEDRLNAMKEDLVEAVRQIVRIPSAGGAEEEGAPFGRGPREALDWTLEHARRMGFRTKNVGNVAGWAELGSGDEMVAVLGHLDVVPAGEGWSVDPWGGELKDGMIWGRGVLDNKGPVMIALYAAKALFDEGIALKRRVRVIFGTNEEQGSKCMKHYVESGEELPAAGFTPDADYPIIYAEKGILSYTLSLPFAPSGKMAVTSLSGGVAGNVVMGEVRAEVTDPRNHCRKKILGLAAKWKGPEGSALSAEEDGEKVRLVMKGRPAHGSRPHEGLNALACLADFMGGLELKGDQGDFFRTFSDLVGYETNGHALGVAVRDDVSGPLTLCVGTVTAKKDRVAFTVDIRHPVTMNAQQIAEPICAALDEKGVTVDAFSATAPLYMPPETRLIRVLQKVYEEETGQKAELLAIGGGTYAKTMPNVVAFGPVFPGQTCKIHEEDERWAVEDIMKNLSIMAKVLLELSR